MFTTRSRDSTAEEDPATAMTKAPTATLDSDVFAARLAALGPSLAPAARRVTQFIDQNRAAVLASSALELAARTQTSDATVIRAVQALGFTGLADLKQALVSAIERPVAPADAMRRTLDDVGDDTSQAVNLVLDAHAEAFKALRSLPSRAAIAEAVGVLHPAERIIVFGIGPSAALATYVALLLTRSGRRSGTLNMTGGMLADQMLDLRAGDALIVLAYGRAYREVNAVFTESRRFGLPVVLVTDSLDRKFARVASVVLPARRGRAERVALHGATLVCLEALVLGLAAAHRTAAITTLERLDQLRATVVANWQGASEGGLVPLHSDYDCLAMELKPLVQVGVADCNRSKPLCKGTRARLTGGNTG